VSQISTSEAISCAASQKTREIKPYTTILASISIILLLSAALVTPSMNAFAEKENQKGSKHQKDRKDKDSGKDGTPQNEKCKPKENGTKYHKDCD